MDMKEHLNIIVRKNYFYLRRIKRLENKSEQELIPYVKNAINYIKNTQKIQKEYSMDMSNFAIENMFGNNIPKNSKGRMGVIIPAKITLDNKITKALSWTTGELYQISSKGKRVIDSYNNCNNSETVTNS